MARSIQEIFDSMKTEGVRLATEANSQAMLDMFGNTSRVAIWKVLFYAVSFSIWTLEKLMDLFRIETDNKIADQKPGSARWYANKAKEFRYGFNLVPESDTYDDTGLTEDQINDSRIVAYAAVVEQERGIRIKVAKLVNGELAALSAQELSAFTAYMEAIKYGGIKLLITSGNPDSLKAKLRIFYNPLVLRADGGRIDGTDNEPVQNALKTYLKNLPFNGLFVPQSAIDQLQVVDGVVIVKDDQWEYSYGSQDFKNIDYEYNPDSGYLRLTNDGLELQFIPHAVI